jgi:proteasome assembly chaperone (PAC2) family protein
VAHVSGIQWGARPKLEAPAAILGFEGWSDAGEAASGAVAHLLTEADTDQPFAALDTDGYFDFQLHRPFIEVSAEGVRRVHWPKVEFYALRFGEQDLVVMLGEEPNLRWREFCDQIISVLKAMSVKRVITLGSFVGEVAHTMPVPIIGVARRLATLDRYNLTRSSYQGPTGITGVATTALLDAGFDCVSLWAAIPHYLSNQSHPSAMEALLRKAAEILDIGVDTSGLAERAAEFRQGVDEALKDSDELAGYVRGLERQTFQQSDPGVKLVEEIERFLRSDN